MSKKDFDIPNNSLLILVGIPGSGKSTIANKIVEKDEANLISSDAIREELLGNQEDNSNNDFIFEEFYKRIDESLKSGKTTIADSTGIDRRTRKYLYLIAAKYNAPIRVLVFNITKQLALKQNNLRDRKVPKEVIDRMYDKLQVEYKQITEEEKVMKEIEGVDIQVCDIIRKVKERGNKEI